MSKKRDLAKNKTLFELSIFLPAFHFLYLQLKSAQQKQQQSSAVPSHELDITAKLVAKIAKLIRSFSALQKDALDISNKAMQLYAELIEKSNTFLLGLELLDLYYNLQDKKIHLGLKDEFMELSDLVLNLLDKETIEQTIHVSHLIYAHTIQTHEQLFGYKEKRVNTAV